MRVNGFQENSCKFSFIFQKLSQLVNCHEGLKHKCNEVCEFCCKPTECKLCHVLSCYHHDQRKPDKPNLAKCERNYFHPIAECSKPERKHCDKPLTEKEKGQDE